MTDRFEKMINTLGWKRVLSAGLKFFFDRQEPEDIEFVEYKNGYTIVVKTGRENVKEAKEFWDEYIIGDEL